MEEILKIIKEKREQLDKLEEETPQEHYYREGAIDTLDYLEAKVSQVDKPVKPACGNCKHFEYSQDYNNVGDCRHPKFSEGIIFQHCDDMYVSEDFGCINFESKSV